MCFVLLTGALAGSGAGSLVLTQQEVTSEELQVDAKVSRAVKVSNLITLLTLTVWLLPVLKVTKPAIRDYVRVSLVFQRILLACDCHALLQPQAQLQKLWGPSMYHKDDLPFSGDLSDMPDVFTPFKDKCEKKSQVGMGRRVSRVAGGGGGGGGGEVG